MDIIAIKNKLITYLNYGYLSRELEDKIQEALLSKTSVAEFEILLDEIETTIKQNEINNNLYYQTQNPASSAAKEIQIEELPEINVKTIDAVNHNSANNNLDIDDFDHTDLAYPANLDICDEKLENLDLDFMMDTKKKIDNSFVQPETVKPAVSGILPPEESQEEEEEVMVFDLSKLVYPTNFAKEKNLPPPPTGLHTNQTDILPGKPKPVLKNNQPENRSIKAVQLPGAEKRPQVTHPTSISGQQNKKILRAKTDEIKYPNSSTGHQSNQKINNAAQSAVMVLNSEQKDLTPPSYIDPQAEDIFEIDLFEEEIADYLEERKEETVENKKGKKPKKEKTKPLPVKAKKPFNFLKKPKSEPEPYQPIQSIPDEIEKLFFPPDNAMPPLDDDVKNQVITESNSQLSNEITPLSDANSVFEEE